LRALDVWPCHSLTGARRLAELDFSEFVALLPAVRDGNSHFRLQIDVLRDAGTLTSRVPWAARATRTLLHLARTHHLAPGLLKTRPTAAADQAALAEAREQSVRWIRLEDLPEAWREVEQVLGRAIALPWRARTGEGDDWRMLYDATLKARVAELYRPDLEMFKYEGWEPVEDGGAEA
jgi:hypothetical protein